MKGQAIKMSCLFPLVGAAIFCLVLAIILGSHRDANGRDHFYVATASSRLNDFAPPGKASWTPFDKMLSLASGNAGDTLVVMVGNSHTTYTATHRWRIKKAGYQTSSTGEKIYFGAGVHYFSSDGRRWRSLESPVELTTSRTANYATAISQPPYTASWPFSYYSPPSRTFSSSHQHTAQCVGPG